MKRKEFSKEPRRPSKKPQPCSTSRKVIKEAHGRAQQTGEDPKLAEHAAMIRRLGKRVIADIIEIGRRLQEAKALVGHGSWEAWLEREFDWSAGTALNFMRVFELAESEDFKSENFSDLRIEPSALYLLAQKNTPDTVRTAVVERAKAGEDITVKTVKGLLPAKAVATELSAAATTEIEKTEDEEARWLRGLYFRANKAIGDAQFGDWTGFEPDAGLAQVVRQAASSWSKLADYIEQLQGKQLDREQLDPVDPEPHDAPVEPPVIVDCES